MAKYLCPLLVAGTLPCWEVGRPAEPPDETQPPPGQGSYEAGLRLHAEAVSRYDYIRAVNFLTLAAKMGHAEAQHDLAGLYLTGSGVEQSSGEALKWYRLAVEQDHPSAWFGLGYMYLEGQGVPRDVDEGIRHYRKAAAAGSPDAAYNLGYFFFYGQNVTQDDQKALKWFRRAGKLGSVEAQSWLGDVYAAGIKEQQNFAKAVRWYAKAAEQQDPDARWHLAWMVLRGQGVAWNPLRAARLLNVHAWTSDAATEDFLALRQGEQTEARRLAVQGLVGLLKDSFQSIEHQTAHLGLRMADRYSIGPGPATDETKAMSWLRFAAKRGCPRAQYLAATRYQEGKWTQPDPREALHWFQRAAEQGYASAQYRLRRLYAVNDNYSSRSATIKNHQWCRLI